MGFIDRLLGRGDREVVAHVPKTIARGGPIQAFTAMDFDSPVLAEFLRDGRVSASGVAVNETMALRNSTFFRAMSLISGTMGMLPVHLMQRDAGGSTVKAREHPLFNVLWRKPNDFMSASQFKSYMQLVALLDGNAYALIVRTGGAVTALIPLARRSVTRVIALQHPADF